LPRWSWRTTEAERLRRGSAYPLSCLAKGTVLGINSTYLKVVHLHEINWISFSIKLKFFFKKVLSSEMGQWPIAVIFHL
jgi:hypothetical protein